MTKPETKIKELVLEAMRNKTRGFDAVTTGKGAHERTTVTIASSYGDITVVLTPESAFTKSFYRIQHPALGQWQGILNGSRNGEYGVRVGKPTQTA